MNEKCVKCHKVLTKDTITHHHILPRCHFKGCGKVVSMCQDCHRLIEKIYLKMENTKKGKRNRLDEFDYRVIYCQFIWGKDYEKYLELDDD